jgi:hypothetical protein
MMLEDSLRESFSRQVERTPPPTPFVDEVIRRGQRARRRRFAGSAVAAVVAFLVLVSGIGVWQALTRPGGGVNPLMFNADPTAAPSPQVSLDPGEVAGIGLDLRIGDRLWTTDGRMLALPGVGPVTAVYRVPGGWLYGGSDGVNLLTDGGVPSGDGLATSRWAVSADGRRIAYVIGSGLHLAEIRPNGFHRTVTVSVPADAEPAVLLGTRVLVSVASGRTRAYTYVDPAVPASGPPATDTWNTGVVAVYGTRSDAAAALVRPADGASPCLAGLRPAATGMTVAQGADCGLAAPQGDATHRLSPDGGWLAQPAGGKLELIDLDRSLAATTAAGPGAAPSVRRSVACAANGVRQPAWINVTTVAAAYRDGVVRCRTDGTSTLVALPPQIGSNWTLVPRVGSTSGG